MADRIFDPLTFTPSATDFDGGWHTFGVLAELDTAGNLVGGSAWFPNPTPANFHWLVYKVSDESAVAEVDLAALPGTAPGWNVFTSAAFDTPGDVALDDSGTEQYVVAYATDGDFTYRDTGVAFPYGTGIVHATEGRFINGGAGGAYPDTGTSGFVFPVDMLVDAGGPAPIAATGIAAAAVAARATVKKVAKTSPAAVTATAGSTSTARKTSPATGRTAGAAVSPATAVKIARVAAACSAAAGTRSTATTGRRAAATGTASAAASFSAAKRSPAAGAACAAAAAYKAAADVRTVTATCSATATTVATATAYYRHAVHRPNSGLLVRPGTGVVLRP